MRGPASMEGANATPPVSFTEGWWDNGWPMRSGRGYWHDRGLSIELGNRAYGMLVIEARGMFPPGLDALEDIRFKAEEASEG